MCCSPSVYDLKVIYRDSVVAHAPAGRIDS